MSAMDSPWVCGACYQVVSGRPSVTHSPAQLIATRMTTIPPSSHRRTDPPPVDIGACAYHSVSKPVASPAGGIGTHRDRLADQDLQPRRVRVGSSSAMPLAVDVNTPSHRPVTGGPGSQLATNGACPSLPSLGLGVGVPLGGGL